MHRARLRNVAVPSGVGSPPGANASRCRSTRNGADRARGRLRGATAAEALVVAGTVALAGMAATTTLGSTISRKAGCFGDALINEGAGDDCGSLRIPAGAPSASAAGAASAQGPTLKEAIARARERSLASDPRAPFLHNLAHNLAVLQQRRVDAARQHMQCAFEMQHQSTEAHKKTDVCGFKLLSDHSNDVMQVWVRVDPEDQSHEVHIVFRGSRVGLNGKALGDWWNNGKAEIQVKHVNQMTGQVDKGWVGKGWQDRWRNQLAWKKTPNSTPLRALLEGWMHDPSNLNVSISGHSQGAADATLAGYDIAAWLKQKRDFGQVTVYAFNSPKPGNGEYAAAYRKMMQTGKLNFFGMFRNGDPVPKLPVSYPGFGFQHIVPEYDNKPVPWLNYCPQYQAPARSWVNPIANHDIDPWKNDIGAISDEHMACMGKAFEPAPGERTGVLL